MRNLSLVLCLLLGGCSSGLRYYEPVSRVDKAGRTYQHNEIVADIQCDAPGLTSLNVGKLSMTFSGETMTIQEAVYNRAGNWVATLTHQLLPGLYPSRTIAAKGVANSHTLDSAGATGTGIISSVGTSLVTGGVVKGFIP